MASYTVKALDECTWQDFARLVEKHNGVWGGCWCLGFHQNFTGSVEGNRDRKHELVCAGKARAALVFDGDNAVGWCQFGRPDELPGIKHRKAYEAGLERQPDWRITCFFVDKEYRGRGVASAALEGALHLIAQLGGGLVESSPEDTTDRKTGSAFLYNSTVSVFERSGFTRVRQLGKHHWLVSKVVDAARPVHISQPL